MRVLFIVGTVVFDVFTHMVDFFQKNGIEVDVKKVVGSKKKGNWKDLKYNSRNYYNLCRKRNYDFILVNTHTNPLKSFFQAVKPKIGFIGIEHDLLKFPPQIFPNYRKSAMLTFQKYDYAYAKKLGDRSVLNCRWTKLDTEYDYVDYNMLNINQYEDAIVTSGPGISDKNFSNGIDGFNKLWCKKYTSGSNVPTGTETLPDIFYYPKGVKYCCDACKFIITARSSIYLEALLFGSMPILLNKDLESESRVNDLISKVALYGRPDFKFNAITTTDCGYKVDKLRNDTTLFEEIRMKLLYQWVEKDYFQLPSTHEAIYNYIRKF